MFIEHKGKTLETKFFGELTDEECEEIRKEFYEKPKIEEVRKNLSKICNGGKKISTITNYYFKDLMAKVRLHHSKWSLEELFECNDLIRYVYGKTLFNKKIFPDNQSKLKNIETAIRLSGKGSASKPTNFPLDVADSVLEKYNVNNVYYDYSCGWGVRLLSSLRHNIEYLGTDPNYVLVSRLECMAKEYDRVNKTTSKVSIKAQGSEILNEEWINKVGLAFSSIPYFDLEDYKIGNQSYKEGTTYSQWKTNYLTPTIKNIKKYLVHDGNFLINVNNVRNLELVRDTKELCQKLGFEYMDSFPLKNISRTKSTGKFNNDTEVIMHFKKVE